LKSITSFAAQALWQIDYLLNNAGINSVPNQPALSLTLEDLQEQITTNVLGPAKTVEVLQQYLHDGSVVTNMTSGLGSHLFEIQGLYERDCIFDLEGWSEYADGSSGD